MLAFSLPLLSNEQISSRKSARILTYTASSSAGLLKACVQANMEHWAELALQDAERMIAEAASKNEKTSDVGASILHQVRLPQDGTIVRLVCAAAREWLQLLQDTTCHEVQHHHTVSTSCWTS